MSKKDVTYTGPHNGSTPTFIEHNDEARFIAASILWGGPSYPQPASILEQMMNAGATTPPVGQVQQTIDIDHEVVEDLQLPPASE